MFAVSIVSLPPSGMASREFTARLSKRALELMRIDFDAPQPAAEHGLDGDVLAQRAANQVGHARDQPIDVGRLGIERLAAGERQQLLRQRCGALRTARRLIHRASQASVVLGT